jgi:cellulose synthase/poly-beta-1,6-N-acetylglucosamine synthase-like glycosyltransferase
MNSANNGRSFTVKQSSPSILFKKTKVLPIAIIIPAFNEETTIHKTLESLNNQSCKPEEIIVVDDFSSDKTGAIAKSFGATVVRTPKNTGNKADAQSFSLQFVKSKYIVSIDADTILKEDSLEKMFEFMELNPDTSACCNFVIPQKIKTVWERGRFLEYMFVFSFSKRIQNWHGRPLTLSGCFSIFKADDVKKIGGWRSRTMLEDIDLTWTLYENGKIVKCNTESFCFPLEPDTFKLMSKQLKRWSHGWFQNVVLHRKKIMKIPGLREQVVVGTIDALFGSLFLLIIMPLLSIFSNNYSLMVFTLVLDILLFLIPSLIIGYKTKHFKKVITSLPSFLLLKIVNIYYIYEAFISEVILKKRLTVYEKGH